MTDEQIIKALEHNASKCKFYEDEHDGGLFESTLDLINRQKAKIEELRSDKIIAERHEKDARDLFVDCTRQLEEAKAEIRKLKNEGWGEIEL